MAAAATQLPAPPGLFTFLKHGVLLPARNRGLFLPLTAALAAALLLHNSLPVLPNSYGVLLDADAISRADPSSVAYPVLVESLRGELRRLFRDVVTALLIAVDVGSAVKLFMFLFLAATVLFKALYLFKCLVLAAGAGIYTESVSVPYLVAATVGSATYIATVFAAVASHSSGRAGNHASPSSFLRMVRGNLLRPVLTATLGGALKLACGAMVAYNPLPAPVLDKVVNFLALLLYACVEFVFRMAVVASVAEPERCGRGAGAAGRAWLLMRQRGKYEQAKYMLGQWKIDTWFRLVHTLVAMAGFPRGAASGVVQVDATVKCLLLIAEEMLCVANTTAYYFDCRKREEEEEDKAGHGD